MLVITEEEVIKLLPMNECVDVIDRLFQDTGSGYTNNMSRYRLPIPGGTHQIMAGMSTAFGGTGLKTYVIGGGSRVPNMLVLLYDLESAQPLALLSANALGAIRTGAASGVASKYMAKETASTVGIIGTGSQAKTQLSAICCVRPIKSALVFSRNPERREEFAAAMENLLGIPVKPADNVETLLDESEIIATITNAREPVFSGEALKPGTHINAAGSNHWMRREIDESTIKKCETIVVDDLAQAKIEAGDLIWAAERRAFRWDQVLELGQVVSGQSRGRSGPDAITLFESQGLGTEDVAAAMHIYQKAIKMGVGQEISI